ncbi:inositol oxygenase [Polyangium jinanense]|uniref:Inositol oxygenase n=1 Tax=Polyangium jinanense TaxID=2829994 RepID=A0A9X3XBT9_9BACT|nr:inositol oxygenase [Polyangium jinanense]MDC3985893.1 inositol oxygenase [Polyangium jinanense]
MSVTEHLGQIQDGKRAAATTAKKETSEFRDYRAEARPSVKELYRLNHEHQTLSFVEDKKRQYLSLDRRRAGMWEVLELLDRLVDDSDPDTEQSQIAHALQSAEAARRDDQPPWFVLTALIHDAGKMLCLSGEPQWAVVGDTFPVGCAFSDRIVFPELFANNPDRQNPRYQTPCGVYEEGCGLSKVHMSWGHDEYLYHVVKEYLPLEAQYMIRYHSFYAAHREGAYGHLMNEQDRQMMEWVRRFNPYDLYSKADAPPDVAKLRPYYQDLIAKYLPAELRW